MVLSCCLMRFEHFHCLPGCSVICGKSTLEPGSKARRTKSAALPGGGKFKGWPLQSCTQPELYHHRNVQHRYYNADQTNYAIRFVWNTWTGETGAIKGLSLRQNSKSEESCWSASHRMPVKQCSLEWITRNAKQEHFKAVCNPSPAVMTI